MSVTETCRPPMPPELRQRVARKLASMFELHEATTAGAVDDEAERVGVQPSAPSTAPVNERRAS